MSANTDTDIDTSSEPASYSFGNNVENGKWWRVGGEKGAVGIEGVPTDQWFGANFNWGYSSGCTTHLFCCDVTYAAPRSGYGILLY